MHDTYQYQLPDIKILTVCRLTFGLSKLKHTQTHVFGHNHSDISYLSKNAEITLTTKIIQEYIDIKLLYMNINIFRLFNGTKTITSISWSELIHIPLPLTWITIFKALYISRLLIYQTAPIHIIWWSIEYNKPQTRVHHYQMGRQAKTITHRPFNIRQPIDQWIKRRRLLDHNWSAAAKAAVVGYVVYSLKIWFYI